MTTPTTSSLAALLENARVLLLDFDGPVCAIFAGHPAPGVARALVDALRADGISVPEQLDTVTDPFDVLRFAGSHSHSAAELAHKLLRAAELDAVATARPTPHAKQLITTWRRIGRVVAAVSNNSEAAVTAYLSEHQVPVDLIVGRTDADPSLLKPSPYLVRRAISDLNAATEQTLFVGDSPSDVVAGREAGIETIGYANKPGKHERLAAAGARVVIDGLSAITAVLPASN